MTEDTTTLLENLNLEIHSPDTADASSNYTVPTAVTGDHGQRLKHCSKCGNDFIPKPRQRVCDSCRAATPNTTRKNAAPKSPAATRATADTLAKLITGATVLYAMWLVQPFPSITDTDEYELTNSEAAAIATPLARVLASAAPRIAQRVTGSEDLMLAAFAAVSYAQRVIPMHQRRLDAGRKIPKARKQEATSREAHVNGEHIIRPNPGIAGYPGYGLGDWQLGDT